MSEDKRRTKDMNLFKDERCSETIKRIYINASPATRQLLKNNEDRIFEFFSLLKRMNPYVYQEQYDEMCRKVYTVYLQKSVLEYCLLDKGLGYAAGNELLNQLLYTIDGIVEEFNLGKTAEARKNLICGLDLVRRLSMQREIAYDNSNSCHLDLACDQIKELYETISKFEEMFAPYVKKEEELNLENNLQKLYRNLSLSIKNQAKDHC